MQSWVERKKEKEEEGKSKQTGSVLDFNAEPRMFPSKSSKLRNCRQFFQKSTGIQNQFHVLRLNHSEEMSQKDKHHKFLSVFQTPEHEMRQFQIL